MIKSDGNNMASSIEVVKSSKVKKSCKSPQIIATGKIAKATKSSDAATVFTPQARPSGSSFHMICLRLTLIFCISGATVGFCLLIAGGVARHMEEMKMLMYIGIMIFLVSVALLVIMCSTWGTGGVYHMVQRPTDQFLYSIKPTSDQMMYTYPKTYMKKGYPMPFHCPYPVPSPRTNTRYFDPRLNEDINPTIIHKPEPKPKPCSVKNCVCQVRNQEEYSSCQPQPPSVYQVPIAHTDWQVPSYRMGNSMYETPSTFNPSNQCTQSYNNNNVNSFENHEDINLSWEAAENSNRSFIMNPSSLPGAYPMNGAECFAPTYLEGFESRPIDLERMQSDQNPNINLEHRAIADDESSML